MKRYLRLGRKLTCSWAKCELALNPDVTSKELAKIYPRTSVASAAVILGHAKRVLNQNKK